MVSKELNDWLQVVGLFGVLGGLIFVGIQLKQDRDIALVEGVTESSFARLSWADLVVQHAGIWTKRLSGESLSASETIQFEELARAMELQHFNNWYRIRQIGNDVASMRFVREFGLDVHTSPGLQTYWEQHQERMREVGLDGLLGDEWVTEVNQELLRLEKASASN